MNCDSRCDCVIVPCVVNFVNKKCDMNLKYIVKVFWCCSKIRYFDDFLLFSVFCDFVLILVHLVCVLCWSCCILTAFVFISSIRQPRTVKSWERRKNNRKLLSISSIVLLLPLYFLINVSGIFMLKSNIYLFMLQNQNIS